MTSLLHFEDRVHRRSLPRAESLPILFPHLLCQVLEHIGFLAEPRIERRRNCETTLTIEQWSARPRAFHLPPPGSNEDEPDDDSPSRDLSPIVEHVGGLHPSSQVSPPVSSAAPATHSVSSALPATPPVAPALVPQALIPSTSPQTSGSMPTVRSDMAGPSTSAHPPQYITLSAGTS